MSVFEVLPGDFSVQLDQGPARYAVGLLGVSEQQRGPFAAGRALTEFLSLVAQRVLSQPTGWGETAQVEGHAMSAHV